MRVQLWTARLGIVCADDVLADRRHERIRQTYVLAPLATLADKSLVMVEAANARFRLLEPLREYAGERLLERGSAELRRCHDRQGTYFLDAH